MVNPFSLRPSALQACPCNLHCLHVLPQPLRPRQSRERKRQMRVIGARQYELGHSEADDDKRTWCYGGRHGGRAGAVPLETARGAGRAGPRGAVRPGPVTQGVSSFTGGSAAHRLGLARFVPQARRMRTSARAPTAPAGQPRVLALGWCQTPTRIAGVLVSTTALNCMAR